jgi:hypothetical protein
VLHREVEDQAPETHGDTYHRHLYIRQVVVIVFIAINPRFICKPRWLNLEARWVHFVVVLYNHVITSVIKSERSLHHLYCVFDPNLSTRAPLRKNKIMVDHRKWDCCGIENNLLSLGTPGRGACVIQIGSSLTTSERMSPRSKGGATSSSSSLTSQWVSSSEGTIARGESYNSGIRQQWRPHVIPNKQRRAASGGLAASTTRGERYNGGGWAAWWLLHEKSYRPCLTRDECAERTQPAIASADIIFL